LGEDLTPQKNNFREANMKFRVLTFIVLNLFFVGCAQFPQSSVTLSNSIAADVLSMQIAHKNFINYYFDNLEKQANDLINSKYRPSLLRKIIEQDVAKFSNSATKEQSLFNAIQVAFINNQNLSQNDLEKIQSNAMAGLKIFYTKIDEKVELERKNLLNPLEQQRLDLLSTVDANYANIIKKNAAITALLNSIVKVNETQQKLFEMAGIKENVSKEVGSKLADLSGKIEEIQSKLDKGNSQVEEVENAINELKKTINHK
jgi:hypothetical protein